MKPCEDLTGRRFGHLVVEYRCDWSMCGAVWHCRCENCGGSADVRASALRNGSRISCGCLWGRKYYDNSTDK